MKEIIITDYVAGQLKNARWDSWTSIVKKAFLIPAIIISGLAIPIAYGRHVLFAISIAVFLGLLYVFNGIDTYGKRKQLRVLKHGKEGEVELRNILRKGLGNEYVGFFGVPIDNRGDLDCVVVGPDSIFVIESKHHSGLIQEKDGDLVQIKIGRRGSAYAGNLNKPVRQLSSNIHRFKELLGKKKIDVWLEGVLVFTNEETNIENGKIRNIAVLYKDDLCGFIKTGAQRRSNKKSRDAFVNYLYTLKPETAVPGVMHGVE